MKTVAVLAVLAVLLTIGSCDDADDDLKCYVCNDCQPSFVDDLTDANTETCQDAVLGITEARCVKEIISDVVNRRCGFQAADCDLGEALAKCDGEDVQPCRICCDTDKCNSATTSQVSAVVLLVVAAVHKFLF